MLRHDFVRRKLRAISQDIDRLAKLKRYSFEEITGDFMRLAALERILERIVMRAVDINEHLVAELAERAEGGTARLSYKDTFLRLADMGVCPRAFAERIAQSAGLRNILVHDYNDVDRRIVYGSMRRCMEDYRRYCGYVLGFIGRPAGQRKAPRKR
ncbi:MAG: DUF86 domain-containing protein [Elusimicrobia bacterium]|nr:DUF86 domain-containing protein [Elusimicrobiota bacterium]